LEIFIFGTRLIGEKAEEGVAEGEGEGERRGGLKKNEEAEAVKEEE
jgi:hypothetical protein